ncbi:MAG TPA: CHAP domain-containing protein [Candidatus Kapabacteria bacterium]|nr:CHAP domain-containing protein [Candidatus Kapabacteria bacterium]
MAQVNRFQQELVRTALAWAARGCHETVANGGNCIDEVHRLFGNPARESYCAQFVWVVTEQAAQAAGIPNPLPKTAGACDLLTRSLKAGLRVDKTPGIGAVFYHGADPRYSTGHVGVVIDVTSTAIRTVEGNSGDRIDDWTYALAKVLTRKQTQACQRGTGFDFIHIEDAGGVPDLVYDGINGMSPSPSFIAVTATVGAAIAGFIVTQMIRS